VSHGLAPWVRVSRPYGDWVDRHNDALSGRHGSFDRYIDGLVR